VWRLCDGRTGLAELAASLRDVLGVPDGEAAVRLALEQLSRRGLLEQPVEEAAPAERIGRREALRKLAVLGALPIILTVAARHASAMVTPCSLGPCFGPGTMKKGKCVATQLQAGASCQDPESGDSGTCDAKGNCNVESTDVSPPILTDCSKQECTNGTGCGAGCKCPKGGNGKCVAA
jgi:hypothetical protein